MNALDYKACAEAGANAAGGCNVSAHAVLVGPNAMSVSITFYVNGRVVNRGARFGASSCALDAKCWAEECVRNPAPVPL